MATMFHRAKISLESVQTGDEAMGGPVYNPVMEYYQELSDGLLTGQCDRSWFKEFEIAASTTQNVCLYNNNTVDGIVSPWGGNLKMLRVVGLMVTVPGTTDGAPSGAIDIGAAASNGYWGFSSSSTHKIRIRAGGAIFLVAPDTTSYGSITPGTGDTIALTNISVTPSTVRIAVLGRSAW